MYEGVHSYLRVSQDSCVVVAVRGCSGYVELRPIKNPPLVAEGGGLHLQLKPNGQTKEKQWFGSSQGPGY